MRERLKGNPVQFRNGPAAVFGDEIRKCHCFIIPKREGAKSRMIRKSEDLPWKLCHAHGDLGE